MAKPFMDYVKKQKQTEQEREMLTEGLRVREEEITKEILDPTKISILKNRKILELLSSSKSTKKIINKYIIY